MPDIPEVHETAAYTLPVSILLLIMFLVFTAGTIYLLLRGKFKHVTANQLAANSMIGHFIFSIFLFSGVIHMFVLNRVIAVGYCWIFSHLIVMYRSFVPYSLLMFSIDRFIFIRNPIKYAQKIPRWAVIVMLVVPWTMAIIFASSILAIHDTAVVQYQVHYTDMESHGGLFNHTVSENNQATQNITNNTVVDQHGNISGVTIKRYENHTVTTCHLTSERDILLYHIFHEVASSLIPAFFSLICTVVVLVLWCRFKCQRIYGTNYSMMGAEIESMVRDAVLAVSLSNCMYFLLAGIRGSLSAVASLSLLRMGHPFFGVFEGLIWIGTFKNVRTTISYYCCPCCKDEPRHHRVIFDVEEENVTVPSEA